MGNVKGVLNHQRPSQDPLNKVGSMRNTALNKQYIATLVIEIEASNSITSSHMNNWTFNYQIVTHKQLECLRFPNHAILELNATIRDHS